MTLRLNGFLICETLAQADAVSLLLPAHIRASRAEPGCLTFEVWRSMADPTRFAVHEVFRDREAFEAHQTRMRASDWYAGTATLRRDYSVTED